MHAIFRRAGVHLVEDQRRPPVPSPAATRDDDPEQGTLRFARFLRARNQMGETCLHEAVRFGDKSLVDLQDVTITTILIYEVIATLSLMIYYNIMINIIMSYNSNSNICIINLYSLYR